MDFFGSPPAPTFVGWLPKKKKKLFAIYRALKLQQHLRLNVNAHAFVEQSCSLPFFVIALPLFADLMQYFIISSPDPVFNVVVVVACLFQLATSASQWISSYGPGSRSSLFFCS